MQVLDNWLKLTTAGAELAQSGLRTGQTLVASDSVIRSRTETIASAMRNPLDADYAELGRMLPEKITAAGEATNDIITECWRIWSGAGASLNSSPFGHDFFRQSTDFMVRSMGLYAIALAPFHAGATSNARRLSRKHG